MVIYQHGRTWLHSVYTQVDEFFRRGREDGFLVMVSICRVVVALRGVVGGLCTVSGGKDSLLLGFAADHEDVLRAAQFRGSVWNGGASSFVVAAAADQRDHRPRLFA